MSQNDFKKTICCWTRINIILCVLERKCRIRHSSLVILEKNSNEEKILGIVIDERSNFQSNVKNLRKFLKISGFFQI